MALIISISDSISSVVTSRRGAAGTFIVTESGDFITTEFGAFIIPESLACKSLDFDGVNESLISGTEAAFNIEWSTPFSIEMWVKIDTEITSFQTIFNTRGNNGIQIRRQKTNGRLFFELWGSAGTNTRIYANTNILLNKWYHLVSTSDGTGLQSGMEIYVNDVLQPKVTLGGNNINTGTMQNAATSLKIMNYGSQYVDGAVRGVRMWTNRVLNSTDVNTLWNGGIYNASPPHIPDLIANYDMSTAKWNTVEFDIADEFGSTAGLTSVNMEENDLINDCPE
jgi:hypothetical protein